MNSKGITNHAVPHGIGHIIVRMHSVDSTNEEAKRRGDLGAEHGTVYVAEHQTAGKGRRGRSWLSEDAKNLYFTLLLRPDLEPNTVSMLTLVMAYAVAEAIQEQTGLQTGIKWPNDIVIGDKKVCGILSEMKVEKQQCAYCVIGVGINIEQKVFPQELQDKATSLYAELNKVPSKCLAEKPDAEHLLEAVLNKFRMVYEMFCREKSLAPILEQYNALLVNKDRQVRVLEPGHEYEGMSLGITPFGELLVKTEDGTVQKVYAGEVSVRGLYGYV